MSAPRLAFCLVVLTTVAPPLAAEALRLSRDTAGVLLDAEYVLSDAAVPPPAHAAWEAVELPDTWRLHERYLQGTSAWYRFRLADDAPEEPTSLYLWRFSMNAEAFFNDERIGSGGSFDEPVARNWNRPFLWTLPRSAWRDRDNWLFVRLRVYPGFGNLTPPVVGPTALLLPAYEARFFRQITLSQWSMVLTLVLAVIGFAFWLADRRNTTYLYFSLAALSWTTYSLNLFIQDIAVSARVWWWLVHASIDVFALSVVLFAHRLMAVSRPWIERCLLATTAVAVGLYAWWDLPQLARWNNTVHFLMLAGPVYVTAWLGVRIVRHREPDAMVFFASLVIMLGFGVHDLVLNSLAVPDMWTTRSYVTQFAAPAMLLVLVIHLARRLSRAVTESREVNEQLEARVERASAALAEGYAQRQRLESDRVASAERERIYQDLHDDVGAKLLSLIYAAGDSPPAQLARDALQEIRSIINASATDGSEFSARLVDWRSEAERRCEEAGFLLTWEEELAHGEPSGLVTYHLERILRELVSNSLEHSHGRRLDVRLAADASGMELMVEDDGVGFGNMESQSHHGLLGIRRRAARLGGEISWYRGSRGGVAARLTLRPHPPFGG